MKRFTGIFAAVLLLLMGVAVSCAKDDKNSAGKPQIIVVGTSNDYPPLCYLDADGNLAGFERDALEAIDKLLPQYTFKYEVLEFKNILASLESGRLDIAAHSFGSNPEREEKYLFSSEGYLADYSYIVVPGITEGINSLDDLQGKAISVPPATTWAYTIEAFNREHADNPITINYFEATPDVLITNLNTGVVDATLLTTSDVKLANAFWDSGLKTVGAPIGEQEESRYVFQKNAVELRDAIDGALKQLKENGELERLNKKAESDFFGNARK